MSAASGRAGARGGWAHFGIAAGLLLAAAVGFNTAVRVLKVHLVKAPVPWPAGTKVVDHRLANFPVRFGDYVLAGDGELSRRRDGEPDGLVRLRKEQLEELGTTKHRLNWYYQGIFAETPPGEPEGRTGRYFTLHVTYYTGLVDPAPHVPEVCLFVGGYYPLPEESGAVELHTSAPPPWDRFRVWRTAYAGSSRRGGYFKSAEYYVFSVNGQPTTSRLTVRSKLANPLARYVYFAKIQVAPLRPGTDLAACDRDCLRFLRQAVPAVLKFLPSAEDVRRLESAPPGSDD